MAIKQRPMGRIVKLAGTGRIHSKQSRQRGIKEIDAPRQIWRIR